MAKIYYQEDCNLSLLEGKTIAVIGYGSQGHAHALNAKESGCHVIIGLYEGSRSWAKAEAAGFEVYTAAEAAKKADVIMVLINDEKQAKMYKESIEPNLEEGNMLISVFQDAAGQGSKAVEVVIDAIDKKPVEKDYWIDFEEVNKENVAEFKQRAQQ